MAKVIKVSLSRQVLTALDGEKQIYRFDCTTGDRKSLTPTGSFSIYRKDRRHFSAKYKAQMDFAMFFKGGVAIHMSHAVGVTSYLKLAGLDYFGSHGCVRLTEADAKVLFDWAPRGTRVLVTTA